MILDEGYSTRHFCSSLFAIKEDVGELSFVNAPYKNVFITIIITIIIIIIIIIIVIIIIIIIIIIILVQGKLHDVPSVKTKDSQRLT